MAGKKQRFTKWDMLAVAAVLLLAAAVLLPFLPKEDTGAYGELWQNGRLIRRVSLAQDQSFTVTGSYSNLVQVKDGRIAVVRSDCPGADCVHCGWLDSPGRSIVCLPNALEIRIVSGSDVDMIVG